MGLSSASLRTTLLGLGKARRFRVYPLQKYSGKVEEILGVCFSKRAIMSRIIAILPDASRQWLQ
ncbi:hypothetical protein BH10PSE13_BH10PSE13_00140 [soil metagenome]